MKTTVEISDPLFERAKQLAQQQGQPLRALVERGLRRVLEEEEQRAYHLDDCSVDGTGLQEGLSYDAWGKILELANDRG
jgi:hypothetical protein